MTTTPARYRKRPVVIDAVQYDGKNGPAIRDWAREDNEERFLTKKLAKVHGQAWDSIKSDDWGPDITAAVYDKFHETWIGVKDGMYIIRGMKGEYYPHEEDLFPVAYELVDETDPLCTCGGKKGPHALGADDHASHCPARAEKAQK